jgi:hypothetical protein
METPVSLFCSYYELIHHLIDSANNLPDSGGSINKFGGLDGQVKIYKIMDEPSFESANSEFYAILNVARDASTEEIVRAYR